MASSSDSTGPSPKDLSVLLAKDRARYDQGLFRALDPLQIDEVGYASIPELLEQAHLLDLSRNQPNRLSDRTLARIKLDVASKPLPSSSWVGTRNRGPWKLLLRDVTLLPLQRQIGQVLASDEPVKYDQKKYKPSERGDDDSDFEDDGEFTAIPPTPPVLISSFTPASNDDDVSRTEDSDDDGRKAGSDDKNDDDEQSDSSPTTASAPRSTGCPDGDKTSASNPSGTPPHSFRKHLAYRHPDTPEVCHLLSISHFYSFLTKL
ncbi:unnamed protein product [Phytophthora fragariaefolia]|uniref:Unnamed protein product n=1 Tax=Phytophthora fragariaefolia TaxID=1490495 RepID=A0A9W6XYX8_9STRA|nr:unnamed protein product [Phytophthora fragariaefolia]